MNNQIKTVDLLLKVIAMVKTLTVGFTFAMLEFLRMREKKARIESEKHAVDAAIATKTAEVRIANAKKSDSDIIDDFLKHSNSDER